MAIAGEVAERIDRFDVVLGERLRIDDYCLCDVLDTYFVHLRTALLRGLVRPEDENGLVESAHALIEAQAQAYPGLVEYLEKFRYWHGPDPDCDGFLPTFPADNS